jgi:hypothetical protein
MPRQTWLATAARRWRLTVVEVDGWQTRGSESFAPAGVVAHHTAGPTGGGDMPSLSVLINGRPDLDGPLANYGLGRSGTVYVVAAGRANHAGAGGWNGLEGNSSVIGIEAENDGYQSWPPAQLDAYGRLGAAICQELGVPAETVCRHHEWRAEKPDPHDLDGDTGRAQVAELLAVGPTGPPPPPEDTDMAAPATCTDSTGRPWVFYRGTDGGLWARAGHASPFPLGGEVTDAIAAIPGPGGTIDVYAYAPDGACWAIHDDGADWSPWFQL